MFRVATKPDCIFCRRAKAILMVTKNPYEEILIDSEVLAAAAEHNHKTAPVIWAPDGSFIGGFTELEKYLGLEVKKLGET